MSTPAVTPDAPSPVNLPAGSTPPTPDVSAGSAPAVPSAPSPAKPSVFRGILQGALEGMAAGSRAKTFGEGLTAGVAGEEQQRQRQFQNQQAATAQQSQLNAEAATTALHYANIAKINHDLHLLPATKQEAYLNDSVDQTQTLIKADAIAPIGAAGSRGEAQNQVLNLMKQNPGMVYDVRPVRGEDGSVQWQAFQYPHAPLQQDMTLKGLGPDGKDYTIPAGTPADQAGKIQSTLAAKKLDADAKTTIEKGKEGNRLDVQKLKNQGAVDVANIKAAAATSKTATKAEDMVFGTTADGRQVAGSKEEMAQAGVQNAVKLPGTEAQKVVVARQLIGPRKGLFDLVNKDIDNLAKQGKLGVAASRWGDFMAGKVGSEPDFAPLRTHMGLLSTALMQAHVGARGSKDMLQHFKDLANYSISDEKTLRNAIQAEWEYVNQKAMLPSGNPVAGRSGPGQVNSAAQPQVNSAGGQRRVIDLR